MDAYVTTNKPIPEPSLRKLSDGRNWRLNEDYIVPLPDGRTVFIPAGFIFDFASTPRFTWRFFPPASGLHSTPALIHDWLCASGNASWVDAAEIFLWAMEKAGVGFIKRCVIYWAVRSFEPFHKTDVRQDRLRLLQRVAIEQRIEHYSNII